MHQVNIKRIFKEPIFTVVKVKVQFVIKKYLSPCSFVAARYSRAASHIWVNLTIC